ncbi:MAG: ribonuclease H [Pseudomonadota bacterium]
MKEEAFQWKRMQFKGNKVWLATDPKGTPVIRNSKCLIKYQQNQDYEYWVHPDSVQSLNETPSASPIPKRSIPPHRKKQPEPEPPIDFPDNAVLVFTDGACSGNPGPAGIGVVLRHGEHQKEISRYIGMATNNIAELEAIRTGLSMLKNKGLPIRLFTDSSYAIGVLSKGWKASKNQELVGATKTLMAKFDNLKLIKVKGHSGHEENEKADQLAVAAIQSAGK